LLYCLCFVLTAPFPTHLLTSFNISGIAKRIAAAGYAVYAMDYPGFGLSYGLHGYIASFDGMVDHVIEQYARIRGFE
jgi:caffeoylshikimate esterase